MGLWSAWCGVKNNIQQLWWKFFVQERDDMVGIDAAIIMNPKIWKASGHVSGFTDPLVECKKCHQRFRADQISDTCPNCENKEFTEAKMFNLMFPVRLGASEESSVQSYLRGEIAQAMFVNFKNVLDSISDKTAVWYRIAG